MKTSKKRSITNVLIASAEFLPFAKTGGLADMVRAISKSLCSDAYNVRVAIPGYRSLKNSLKESHEPFLSYELPDLLGTCLFYKLDNIELVVIDLPRLFDRPGDPYRDQNGHPWCDNHKRFAMFSRAVAHLINQYYSYNEIDILHLHDWHTAIVPLFLEKKVPCILTIHNFSFQGRVDISDINEIYLPSLEHMSNYYNGISFLHIGMMNADIVTSVSQCYVNSLYAKNRFNRRHIPENFCKPILPILNWVDDNEWNPSTEAAIDARFDYDTLPLRKRNRRAVEKLAGFEHSSSPIMCTLSRITKAKGFSFLARNVEMIIGMGCRLIIIGEGERRLINRFRDYAQRWPASVSLLTPHSDAYGKVALAGADLMIMPSLNEPCGLSQQYAQRFGCLPIGSNIGGLRDTIEHGRTGFLFTPSDSPSLQSALDDALNVLRDPRRWAQMQRLSMQAVATRRENARAKYAELYRSLSNLGRFPADLPQVNEERGDR